jgi:hypothetical protein
MNQNMSHKTRKEWIWNVGCEQNHCKLVVTQVASNCPLTRATNIHNVRLRNHTPSSNGVLWHNMPWFFNILEKSNAIWWLCKPIICYLRQSFWLENNFNKQKVSCCNTFVQLIINNMYVTWIMLCNLSTYNMGIAITRMLHLKIASIS